MKESPAKENFPREMKKPEKPDSAKKPKTPQPVGLEKSGPEKTHAAPAGRASLSLQVAALRKLADAEHLMKNLRDGGYEVFLVRPSASSADQLIRVQVGPFSSEAEAAKVKAKLQKEGYPAITKR